MPHQRPLFNPRPRIETVAIAGRQACYVIDDALLDPDALVDYAVTHRAQFAMAPHNAYPGLELRMPEAFSAQLDDVFRRDLRRFFDARRTQRMYSRLSMVTLPPEALQPAQWICHRDRLHFAPNQSVAASVLYLFHDAALGGTSFYLPKLPEHETLQLVRDSVTLPADAFFRRHGVAPGYCTDSNAYFERVCTVPARWNRLIFYDGDLFHSGDIRMPEKLGDDPRRGRLSLNGFFTCSRNAA